MVKQKHVQVEIAGTKALADLAQKNKNNRVRIAEREESIPAIMQQLVKVGHQRIPCRYHVCIRVFYPGRTVMSAKETTGASAALCL